MLSKYLVDFPQLQKDYTEKYGRAADIKNCHYNSMRLARSEINMAYRTAEQERWNQMDFIVGKEIKTTQNGKHEADVCDDLAGKYPKDFKWVGWHPNCMCYEIPILKTDDEFWALGSEDSTNSVNEVTDVPDGFNNWIARNQDRIARAEERGTLPYFIADNQDYVSKALKGAEVQLPIADKPAPPQLTDEERERRNAERISQLREHYYNGLLPTETAYVFDTIENANMLWDFEEAEMRISRLEKAVKRHMARTADDIRRIQDLADERIYGKEYVEHIHRIEQKLGIKRGKRMTHLQANEKRGNPFFEWKTPYSVNCQSCVVAYELRLLGFDVSAMPNLKIAGNLPYELSWATHKAWIDPTTGKIARKDVAGTRRLSRNGRRWVSASEKQITQELDALTQEPGRYHINWVWREKDSGHIVTLERFKDGSIRIYDPQTGLEHSWSDLAPRVRKYFGVEVLRIDNKLFNLDFAGVLTPQNKAKAIAEKTLGRKIEQTDSGIRRGGVFGNGEDISRLNNRKEINRHKYQELLNNDDYVDVAFNERTGGLKARHREHNEPRRGKKYFEERLTGHQLELRCQEILYQNGFSCILERENRILPNGEKGRALDTMTNGEMMDIKSITSKGKKTINNAFRDKRKQLAEFNQQNNTNYDTLILYFHKKELFNEDKILAQVNQRRVIKKVICVFGDGRISMYQ